MASIMDGVEQRTKIAGHNRVELLMFNLGGRQIYGINVFKIQEVMQCPHLFSVPGSNPMIRGVADVRGKTIPVIDLALAIGKKRIEPIEDSFLIVTEFNRSIQGFLVASVDRIINKNWEDIKPPPKGMPGCYLTSVTSVDDDFLEIIDVERVLSEINVHDEDISDEMKAEGAQHKLEDMFVFVVDDSSVARNQIKRALIDLGINVELAKNGREAYDMFNVWKQEEGKLDKILMLISDVEMPEMDGYTLTAELRKDSAFNGLYIILHTSLSGVFNSSMVETVGADLFLPKFDAEVLGKAVLDRVKAVEGARA